MKQRTKEDPALRRLAALYGIQTAYVDVFGRRRVADREVLEALLAARGVHAYSARRVEYAIDERVRREASQLAQPVYAVRAGSAVSIPLHVPRSAGRVEIRVDYENGEGTAKSVDLDSLAIHGDFAPRGVASVIRRIPLGRLAAGYHRLHVHVGTAESESLLIATPRKAFGEPRGAWGTFAPVYALRSKNDWGIGDFGAADEFLDWSTARGASVFATLPLHPAFCDEPFDPSPYSPVSRLFLNEILVDLDAAGASEAGPGFARLREELAAERSQLRAASLVDYRRVFTMKMKMLAALAEGASEELRRDVDSFVAADAEVLEYARFRAMTDAERAPWKGWAPEPDADPARTNTYLWGQFLADRQLGALAKKARASGIGLYLDFPLGSSPDGYDVWKYRDQFLPGVSAGAPPDHSYGQGQDWGFRPLDPDALRQSGYDFFIRAIRTQLRYAGMLRIDHVMSLHRLFCVPEGIEPARGMYMRYHAEELYAILKLESHRARSIIVGEDLGTVPQYVRKAIGEHGFKRLFVLQRQLSHLKENPPGEIVDTMLASINNHDIPTFAAYWSGVDVADRTDVGIYDADAFARETAKRRAVKKRWVSILVEQNLLPADRCDDPYAIMRASNEYLARSAAAIVLVNVEDLWLETAPQNTPTTTWQRPNWRRKFRLTVADLKDVPAPLSR